MTSLDELRNGRQRRNLADLHDYLAIMEKGLAGDLVLTCTPATPGSSAAAVTAAIGGSAAKFTRTVEVSLHTAAGDIHEWFNGTFAIGIEEETVGNGTAAIADSATVVTLVNGVGTVTIEYIGTWASGDTSALAVTGGTKLGYTVADKTSVDTLVA